MLMGDVVYVKPASRESRLVMVRLEPKAKKKPKREKQNKTKQRETMRTEFIKKIDQSVFVAESKCITSFVLPSDVHGRRR